ncbi:MAG: hypothetical protein ABII72_04385 [Parcubacteria group bacterium]
MIAERITIEWTDLTRWGLEGMLTLDRWQDYDVAHSPNETYQCLCSVSDGHTGLTGIDGGLVVPLREEQIRMIGDLMRVYWKGRQRQKEIYYWFPVQEKSGFWESGKSSPAMRRKSKDAPFKKRPQHGRQARPQKENGRVKD